MLCLFNDDMMLECMKFKIIIYMEGENSVAISHYYAVINNRVCSFTSTCTVILRPWGLKENKWNID